MAEDALCDPLIWHSLKITAIYSVGAVSLGLVLGLALAWVLAKPLICSVITAVTSHAQLETNVKAAAWRLTTAQIQEVEATVAANL